jgi:hypothetical protein
VTHGCLLLVQANPAWHACSADVDVRCCVGPKPGNRRNSKRHSLHVSHRMSGTLLKTTGAYVRSRVSMEQPPNPSLYVACLTWLGRACMLLLQVFMHPWAAGSITPAAATPAVSSGGTPAGAPQQPSSAPPTELLLERWTLQFSRTTASSSSFMHAPPGTSPGASGLGSSTSSARGGSGGGAGSSARAPTDDAGLYKRLVRAGHPCGACRMDRAIWYDSRS